MDINENNNATDTNVGNMKNSIEEDVKIVEDFIDGVSVFLPKYSTKKVEKIIDEESYIAIKHILSNYEKLKKENEKYKRLSEMNLKNAEEFKNNMCEHRCLLKSENEELQKENKEFKKFITEGITVTPHSPYKNYRLDFLRENFVSKKKIKDKIEDLKMSGGSDGTDNTENTVRELVIEVLKDILNESEGE